MHLIGAKEFRALLLVALIGLACSCGLMYGQGTNGSLTGQITDPTGAAIVGANVTLTNTGTSESQIEKTDTTGAYLFKLVPPGKPLVAEPVPLMVGKSPARASLISARACRKFASSALMV